MSTPTAMAGHNLNNRTAQQQFEALDADVKRILCTAYTEVPEETEWTTETVYSKKRNQKTTQVSFNTKLK